jgi:hypothetical protein
MLLIKIKKPGRVYVSMATRLSANCDTTSCRQPQIQKLICFLDRWLTPQDNWPCPLSASYLENQETCLPLPSTDFAWTGIQYSTQPSHTARVEKPKRKTPLGRPRCRSEYAQGQLYLLLTWAGIPLEHCGSIPDRGSGFSQHYRCVARAGIKRTERLTSAEMYLHLHVPCTPSECDHVISLCPVIQLLNCHVDFLSSSSKLHAQSIVSYYYCHYYYYYYYYRIIISSYISVS